MNTVLVVQHEDDAPAGWVGEWMRTAGAVLDVRRCHRGDPLPASLGAHDGLLVLGGEMGANDDATCPWLSPTKQLIREATRSGLPMLGICLGHQLAAVALGGTVGRAPHGRQVGVFDVGWTAEAMSDPLFGPLAAQASEGGSTPAVQWNNDVVTAAPAGSTLLARGPSGTVQVLRFGARAWGVQLHPEVGRDIVASWTQTDPSAPMALDRIGALEPQLRAVWQPPVAAFVDQMVAGRASA